LIWKKRKVSLYQISCNSILSLPYRRPSFKEQGLATTTSNAAVTRFPGTLGKGPFKLSYEKHRMSVRTNVKTSYETFVSPYSSTRPTETLNLSQTLSNSSLTKISFHLHDLRVNRICKSTYICG
jgi:hypothetical protein